MEIILNNPLDMHVHLREGEMLNNVLPFSANYFSAAVAMPNLNEPLIHVDLLLKYRDLIKSLSKDFIPIIPLYLTNELNKEALKKAKDNNIKIVKLYPKNATTNSTHGIENINNYYDIFNEMQELNMMLSIHGETGGEVFNREKEFGNIIKELSKNFPKLKIILEHLSDKESIKLLELNNVFATLTYHHIAYSIEDLLGDKLNISYFCKPILKSIDDRDALLNLALNAHPKVSFGSDSAPHSMEAKVNGAAGVFSSPFILNALCDLFDEHNKINNLEKFICTNAINIYELENELTNINKTIIMEKREKKIPKNNISLDFSALPIFKNKAFNWHVQAI